MEKVIEVLGNIAGVLGILTCIVSGTFRIFGKYTVLDESAVAFNVEFEGLFIFGIGLMVAACLAKLQLLSSRG